MGCGEIWERSPGEFKVHKAEQDELVGLLMPMRPEIVEVESPQAGTPLPDSYQVAPPLS
jgi:hemoglobin